MGRKKHNWQRVSLLKRRNKVGSTDSKLLDMSKPCDAKITETVVNANLMQVEEKISEQDEMRNCLAPKISRVNNFK